MNIEQVKATLKKKGINVQELAVNNLVFEKACNLVYKSIPVPFRWLIGKNRIRNMIQKVRDQIKTIDLPKARNSTSGSQIKTVGVAKAGSTISGRI